MSLSQQNMLVLKFCCTFASSFERVERFVRKLNHVSWSQERSISHSRLVPQRGRLAIVTDAGRDAVDADDATDESTGCGRRSRVVLTPRRWRQVGGGNSADDGGKQARSPGSNCVDVAR